MLNRDHEIAQLLDSFQSQSSRLLDMYKSSDAERTQEIQLISTGDTFSEFYKRLADIKDHHRRYPNQPAENLETAYRRRAPRDGEAAPLSVDNMFTGEESYGRYFDMVELHEQYLNVPGIKGGRRITYLQYLDSFENFSSIKRTDKMTDGYFGYLANLAAYLESFMRRTKPLENLEKLFAQFETEFEKAWEAGEVPGWEKHASRSAPKHGTAPLTQGNGTGIWCADCEKEFNNQNVYNHHLTSKKHVRAAALRNEQVGGQAEKEDANGMPNGAPVAVQRLKEKAISEREFRVKKLAAAMQTKRSDTRVNVERRQGMTERERQQELAALFEDGNEVETNDGPDSDGDDKIYNPLKLPLSWDGKPIPFWLYKLHGLGVEFHCEICGNYVYMGRRAFDKHFNESRHVHGLRCLGITNTTLFREITHIAEAEKLWDKLQKHKKTEKQQSENVVQMEDGEGNVMPEKVYHDLQKQGLL